jgi:hypothetical protein
VRLREGVAADSAAETLWALAELHVPKLTGLKKVLAIGLKPPPPESEQPPQLPVVEPAGVLRSRPGVELNAPDESCGEPLDRGASLRCIRELEAKAATSAFPPLHSLTAYWRLDLRSHPELADKVVARLNRLAEVELAYRELRANDPQISSTVNGRLFAEDQGYLDDAPIGIGAAWVQQQQKRMPHSRVTVCDLEQGWNLAHKDLVDVSSLTPVFGANRAQDEPNPGHHGTAVLGLLAAVGKGSPSVNGVCSKFCDFLLSSHYLGKGETVHPGTDGHVAQALVQALLPANSPYLKAGDVLLLEVQRGLLPVEVDDFNFNAIRLASALGVIVVEAAGNGGFDLDRWSEPYTGRTLRRGSSGFQDSGAILVGAGRAGVPHDRASFSNYGSRLDCYSWGEVVTTCGYGDLSGTGAEDYYTSRFDGTSAASPIIAGAAALLQSLHYGRTHVRLETWQMRALLSDPATGTPQGPNVPGRIGVMPDLRAILRDALRLVPNVYMRRSLGDGGAPPAPNAEISSSPDILAWSGGNAAQHFGEGSLRENLPAPGDPIQASLNQVYIRLRNRGLGAGDVEVRLFASPAATLITPENWIPIGTIKRNQIPQGDLLSVAGALAWTPGSADPFWSFLAVLSPPSEHLPEPLGPPYFDWAVGLPPGGRYFDWAEYRAFVRQPGVAWRNTHRVVGGKSATLPFVVAGTPDQARAFDFEVLQRLPEKATVTFQTVPQALEAKLRQYQKGAAPLNQRLKLPTRPRVTFNHIQLAAGTRAKVVFDVVADASHPLTAGHSLAVRQLWHGEEVGRITWYFGLAP